MNAKCPCQNCNGHIEFDADQVQANTRIECPHCKMETLLFVPRVSEPVVRTPKPRRSGALVIAAITIFAAALIGYGVHAGHRARKSEMPVAAMTNLKPVEGAFGWKLGDKIPREVDGMDTANGNLCLIHPDSEVPPFTTFYLEYLNDGRIYGIKATGKVDYKYEVRAAKDQLMATLTGKYGLRDSENEDYFFGTEKRGACMHIGDDNHITLEYFDNALRAVALSEFRASQEKEDAAKKSALGKNL